MSGRFDLAIRGGTVISSRRRSPLDVYVNDGRIVALEPQGQHNEADRVVDAGGLLVLPGMVDTHVHLMDPGDESREDFPSGTAAAVCNGITTIVEHTHGWPVTSVDRLNEKCAHLRGRSHADFGLAAHVWPDQLGDLPGLWRAGITFFKIFTCATHGVPAVRADLLPEVLDMIAGLDAACLVHCEDDLMTAHNERVLRAAGRLDNGVLAEWRSRAAELVAVGTVALLSRLTDTRRVAVAHVSSPDVLDVLASEQVRGSSVVAETCPQYLFLHEDEALTHGTFRQFTPPARIRSTAEEEAMWAAFNSGAVHHLSTDHAPSTSAQKRAGTTFEAPFGLPGLDTTLPLMLDAALRGRTSLERVVATYAETPSEQYRLKAKGRIAVGNDADIVLIEPTAERTLANDLVLSKAGWTPYHGRTVRGKIVTTLLRGSVVAEDGRPAEARYGQFLPGPGAHPYS